MATLPFEALAAFQAVVREGSFTAAARRLGSDKSWVSRQVKALETHLGVPLLSRSTRSLTLTREGEALHREVEPLLIGLSGALERAPASAALPAGEVVCTTTPDLGRALLAPAVVGFRQRYPEIRVRLELTDGVVDLTSKAIDLALRVGHPGSQSSMVASRVGALEAGFFASPAYLARRGTPETLEELGRHEGLWPAASPRQRSFSPGAAPPLASVTSGDFSFLLEVALLGGGIALLPLFLGERERRRGALARVLPDVRYGNAPLYLVSRPLKPLPARVRLFRDWLTSALRAGA